MRMIMTVMFVLILELEFDLFFSFIVLQIYNTILCHDISSVFYQNIQNNQCVFAAQSL